MKIAILEKEYWWGGIVHDGVIMPYKDGTCDRDLAKIQKYNQSSPLLISSKGRYIWSEDPFSYSFENSQVIIKHIIGEIDFGEGFGNLKAVSKYISNKYFSNNKESLNSLMFTAPQYNTWIEMMYEPTQEKVIEYANNILEAGFPPGLLIIDDNWQDDYGNWIFHSKRFPNPKQMIENLHNLGFKVMLWVCNFVSPDSLTFRELSEEGLLVKNSIGKPAIAEWWNGYSGMLDVSNPKTLKWFSSKLDFLTENYNIDGFKFDSGDIDHFGKDFICSDSTITAVEYGELWGKIGLKYEFNEYRACWKLGGEPLAQRLCDKKHSWSEENGLGSLIPDGLVQGLLGYYYSCPDMIGGGEYQNFLDCSKNLDQELIVRTTQCSALFPMMQFSVAPWRILDKKNLEYCVDSSKLHVRFSEIIAKLVHNAELNNEPIIRSLEYVFPNCGYENIKDQFMLGDNTLVAPVIVKGARERFVIFPEGIWISDEGLEIIGPCELQIKVPLSRLPYFKLKLKYNNV